MPETDLRERADRRRRARRLTRRWRGSSPAKVCAWHSPRATREKLAPLCAETSAPTASPAMRVEPDQSGASSLHRGRGRGHGAPDVVVYNASARARGPAAELVPAEVERAIMVSAFGGFSSRARRLRRMVPKAHGAILFTGAPRRASRSYPLSGALRDGQGLRSVAWLRAWLGNWPRKASTLLISSSTARSATRVGSSPHRIGRIQHASTPTRSPPPGVDVLYQPRSAWAWEVELRPWVERF